MAPVTQPQRDGSKKKALLIAVRYEDLHEKYPEHQPPFRIDGTHGDPPKIARLLKEKYGYDEQDIIILMDDDNDGRIRPTRENILQEMHKLVEDARSGDHFVFHYSGHGSQIKNYDGTEEDGYDEVIWPVDVKYDPSNPEEQKDYIKDDELKEILVDRLPAGARLTCILDCCHSGTGLDLPHTHSDSSLDSQWSPVASPVSEHAGVLELEHPTSPRDASERQQSLDTVMALSRSSTTTIKDTDMKNVRGISQSMKMPYRTRGAVISCNAEGEPVVKDPVTHVDKKSLPKSATENVAHVTSWSACMDDQLGLDTYNGGILTSAFIRILAKNQHLTNKQMLEELSKELFNVGKQAKEFFTRKKWGKLPQPKPCLGSLRPLDEIFDEAFTF